MTGDEKVAESPEGTAALGDFRMRFYGSVGRRADVLFGIANAIPAPGPVVTPSRARSPQEPLLAPSPTSLTLPAAAERLTRPCARRGQPVEEIVPPG